MATRKGASRRGGILTRAGQDRVAGLMRTQLNRLTARQGEGNLTRKNPTQRQTRAAGIRLRNAQAATNRAEFRGMIARGALGRRAAQNIRAGQTIRQATSHIKGGAY